MGAQYDERWAYKFFSEYFSEAHLLVFVTLLASAVLARLEIEYHRCRGRRLVHIGYCWWPPLCALSCCGLPLMFAYSTLSRHMRGLDKPGYVSPYDKEHPVGLAFEAALSGFHGGLGILALGSPLVCIATCCARCSFSATFRAAGGDFTGSQPPAPRREESSGVGVLGGLRTAWSRRKRRACCADEDEGCSSETHGFSSAIAFTRQACEPEPEPQAHEAGVADDEQESLEASWERMQRSLKAGTAEKLDVQMQIDVTR